MTRSGLRNPGAAVRGAGAVTLAAMALVLLLAIVPFIKTDAGAAAVATVVVLALVAVVLCGLLGRAWAWYAAMCVPLALVAAGFLDGALAVLGVLFGLVWAYILTVRHAVLGRW